MIYHTSPTPQKFRAASDPAVAVYANHENDQPITCNGREIQPGEVYIGPNPVEVSGDPGQLFQVEAYRYVETNIIRTP